MFRLPTTVAPDSTAVGAHFKGIFPQQPFSWVSLQQETSLLVPTLGFFPISVFLLASTSFANMIPPTKPFDMPNAPTPVTKTNIKSQVMDPHKGNIFTTTLPKKQFTIPVATNKISFYSSIAGRDRTQH